MSEAMGWAVVSANKLYVRSVSETRRAAIVNWLLTEKDVCVMSYHTDLAIEEMWKHHGRYVDCREVTIHEARP